MENEEVGKMLANIYGNFAGIQDGGVRKFKNGLFKFYVTMDNVHDQADTLSTILHFVEDSCKSGHFSEYYAEDMLKEVYQLAYYKGEASKLKSWFEGSWLKNRAASAIKSAQKDIDDCVKSIIVTENRKKEYLKKCFSSKEFKKYSEIIQAISKDGDEKLHPELGRFAESFNEVQRNVKMYDTNIDKDKTELYNMMTNSNCKCVGSIGNFNSFLEKEIARVSAEDKTLANPDGQGK